mmetsp:Transcript_4026/g.9910  ORF Transcript_4026/g.9910 Transcript_4026/m.9910 type:complete len:574 (-) Transcript_4026:125-1846(-)
MRLSPQVVTMMVSILSSSLRMTSSFARIQPLSFGVGRIIDSSPPRGGATYQISSSATSVEEETAIASSTSPYMELLERLDSITQLGRASAVLGYDQLVFMPGSASGERGKQMSALATVIHEKQTDPKILELLEAASKSPEVLDDKDAQRLIEIEKKAFLENERVPTALAAKAASLQASAYSDWVSAKEKDDFSLFAPTLQECFDTSMALASTKRGDAKKDTVTLYDQMLDEFEVGMPQSRIDEIFAQVQDELVPLIARVLGPDAAPPSAKPLEGTFEVPKQQKLSEKLVTAIGFDRSNGRIDVSVHPFTSSMSSTDVRITSRFRDDEWYQGLAGTLHEGGHAIYEQNINPSALSIDAALSMGTHESQSLFWERHIGLSKPFWKFATPYLKESFPEQFGDVSDKEFYGAVNRVSQSFIRVEADELTYPLHVVLRYNIEKDVIAGKLNVSDISERWNQDMKKLLNVDVPSDSKGALQDVHWSGLAFGYFPTYLIGAITAAQLYHYCEKDIPDLETKIESGDFGPIKEWLTSKVHKHGRRYPSLDAMLEDQLGEQLNPTYFIDYLTTKYEDLYQLD